MWCKYLVYWWGLCPCCGPLQLKIRGKNIEMILLGDLKQSMLCLDSLAYNFVSLWRWSCPRCFDAKVSVTRDWCIGVQIIGSATICACWMDDMCSISFSSFKLFSKRKSFCGPCYQWLEWRGLDSDALHWNAGMICNTSAPQWQCTKTTRRKQNLHNFA